MKDIVISNPKELEEKKRLVSKDGVGKLQILADFDRTLTTAFVGGKRAPSIISILRDENYLTPGYSQKAKELYSKYHPIEIDPKVPMDEKKEKMREWWTIHFDLLIKCGLNKKDLENIIKSEKIRFRDGFSEFVDLLKNRNIPLIIMSASGLGDEVISMCLKKKEKLYDNVYIISNSFQWDENENAIAVKKPIIHVMNKDETAVQDFPAFEVIKDRKNVLLLGDSLGDVGMVTGFDYDNLIKIGFLNENIEESLKEYKQNFDVIIMNDSSLGYVNALLKEIIKI